MKEYDWSKNEVIYKCQACGYTHIKIYPNGDTIQGDDIFNVLGKTIKHNEGYPSTAEEVQLYACPKCGTVFIEI